MSYLKFCRNQSVENSFIHSSISVEDKNIFVSIELIDFINFINS